MKFSCTQENLLRGLNLVSRVASRAGNLPILSNVYIKAEQEGILLKATNLEIGITYHLRGKVEEEGEFTVPAKLFTDYISGLPKEKVDIILSEQAIGISCGRHKTTLNGISASDFPLIPQVEEDAFWAVSPPALLEGLEQVLIAISTTESRPEISGASFTFRGSELILAGTDSYRLAEKKILAQGSANKETHAIVPLRALQELERICLSIGEENEAAKIIVGNNQLAVSFPAVEFVTRLIDGQYPDYQAIIPTKFGTQAVISRAEFASSLKAAGLFSKAGVYDVGVEIDAEKNIITIAGLNSQTGEHTSIIDAAAQGQTVKIAFNWKYLLDGLNALKSEKIILKATDSASPTLLSEDKGDDYFYIVMPIKE